MSRILQHIILLLFAATLSLTAQDLPTVCRGDQDEYFVEGWESSFFEWTLTNLQGRIITEGLLSNQGNDTVLVNWDVQEGTYLLSVTEHSEYGCYDAPQVSRVIVHDNQFDLGSYYEICYGDSVTLTPDNPQLAYDWQDGSSESEYIARITGWYRLRGINSYGCIAVDSAEVVVHDLPVVDLGADSSLCGLSSMTIDVGFFRDYRWQIGDYVVYESSPIIPVGPKEVILTVTDFNDCQNSDTLNILACDLSKYVLPLPNTITPNGDGDHDEWVLFEDLQQVFPNVQVDIFDRWGRLVWHSDSYANDFKGNDLKGRELPMDSYQYIINFNVPGTAAISGFISVVR